MTAPNPLQHLWRYAIVGIFSPGVVSWWSKQSSGTCNDEGPAPPVRITILGSTGERLQGYWRIRIY